MPPFARCALKASAPKPCRGGDRIGIYFAESGASQRASVVVYDRARSAISDMEPATVDWPGVVQRGGLVSRDRDHAGAWPEGGARARPRQSRRRRRPAPASAST